MPIHDAYARATPFERWLPTPDFALRYFPGIGAEALERGVDLVDPGAFAVLEAAASVLDELRVPGDTLENLPRHAVVLFHAFHHDAAGRPLLLVRESALRAALAGAPAGEGTAIVGKGGGLVPCGYVQLPQHLVWARLDGEVPPQSVDGFFWTAPGDGSVHLMAVAGLLERSSGFTTLPLSPAPLADRSLWSEMVMRPEGGSDFVCDLPGAELEGLLEVRTAGELLKLAARLDAGAAARAPVAGGREGRPPPAGGASPLPSALPYLVLE